MSKSGEVGGASSGGASASLNEDASVGVSLEKMVEEAVDPYGSRARGGGGWQWARERDRERDRA